jgi:hypothetical protein
MFDYDARPVTPLPVLVGTAASWGAYAIRDSLSRNGYPFEWVDAGQPDAVRGGLECRRGGAFGAAVVHPRGVGICGIWSVSREVWPQS